MASSDDQNPGGSERSSSSPAMRQGMESVPLLQRALANTGVSVLYCDSDFRYAWAQNLPAFALTTDIAGALDSTVFVEDIADRLSAAKSQALAANASQQLEIAFMDDGEPRWLSIWIDLDIDGAGRNRGLMTTIVETTEHKFREQTLRTLLREVAHRSKNLLAIIQSIMTQTGRYATDIDTFSARLRGRLQSLASTQDLVTSSNWRGADLHELVRGQVGRYMLDAEGSVSFKGESPYLNPNACLHVGLALHELVVNSLSYGALSRPGGQADITTAFYDAASGNGLEILWIEAIGQEDVETGRKRFGSVALERIVPASLNGEATLRIGPGMLTYRLLVPRENFAPSSPVPRPEP